MKAFYRVSGAVRLEMSPASTYSYEVDQGGGRRLIVARDEYEELAEQIRDGDGVRADLKRSLEATKGELTATRSRLATLQEAYDAATQERDALRFLQSTERPKMALHLGDHKWTDGLIVLPDQPKRVWKDTDLATLEELAGIAATAPVGSLVDDLKNTIVSQAREIARLKGESE